MKNADKSAYFPNVSPQAYFKYLKRDATNALMHFASFYEHTRYVCFTHPFLLTPMLNTLLCAYFIF